MKKVVISCGPIPARLDSVKFITNRFKGGLAFKTAKHLIDSKKYDVTIVKWIYTDMPENLDGLSNVNVVNVRDVFEYYDWYEKNAQNHDAFIMAAAVANLTPSNPYENKFPSHNYKVGEKFNIEFEIAPRAIDVIKKVNPRACLIGYKLYDAKTDDELVEIARHTMSDAKANVIFANTPKTAKNRKLAVLPDNSVIPMTFDEHLNFIIRAIDAVYFSTKKIEMTADEITLCQNSIELVNIAEKSFPGFGTIAFHLKNGGMVTTSRGHRGEPVYVRDVDFKNHIVYANEKATLNAPTMFKALQDTKADYIIHRHEFLKDVKFVSYLFPGTVEEVKKTTNKLPLNILFHGYLSFHNFKEVDWNQYLELFPKKYFSHPQEMDKFIQKCDFNKTLEVGGNKHVDTAYALDPFVQAENATNITYADLPHFKFELILLKNSISYLSDNEIQKLINSLLPGGKIIANTFYIPPDVKVTENELAIKNDSTIKHYLFVKDDIYVHNFNAFDYNHYEKMGFTVEKYGRNSVLMTYSK